VTGAVLRHPSVAWGFETGDRSQPLEHDGGTGLPGGVAGEMAGNGVEGACVVQPARDGGLQEAPAHAGAPPLRRGAVTFARSSRPPRRVEAHARPGSRRTHQTAWYSRR
jgi:hypothetical protein